MTPILGCFRGWFFLGCFVGCRRFSLLVVLLLSVVSIVVSKEDDAKEDDIVGDDSGDGNEVDVMVIIMYR